MVKLTGLKDLTSVGLSDTIGSGITGIFWFYIASLIEPEAYGEIFYFIGIAGLAQIISLVAPANVMTVYAAKNVKIQSTFFLMALIVGTVSSISLIVIFLRFDIGLLVLGFILSNLATSVLLGKKQYSAYMKYILIQKILTLVVGIGFYFIFGVSGIIFALVISFIHYIPLVYKEFKTTKIDFALFKSRKTFIINNYAVMVASGFRRDVDKLIVPVVLGFGFLGNYALAMQVIMVLMILPTVVYKYILPHDADGRQNKKLKKLTVLASIGISVFSILIMPIIIPIFFPKYSDTIEAIQIMSLSIVPMTISLFYTSKFLGLETSRPILIATLIQFVIVVSGIITLGPIFETNGLAITQVIGSAAHCIFLIFSHKMRITRPNP